MNLTPNDKLKLEGALKDMSTSMTRVEAERDFQKNVIGDICEELNLNKKVFRKLAKVYHKQNFIHWIILGDVIIWMMLKVN